MEIREQISAMLLDPANSHKLELLNSVAQFIFGNDYVEDVNGEKVVLDVIRDQAREIGALKRQLPFLMNIKAGSSADQKASSIYEDVYDQLVDLTEPHIKEISVTGSEIGKDGLSRSIVENYSFLISNWLENKK